jgi:hypothetical protein
MRIYHGSRDKIEKPIYGKGKLHNDYGQGFYCTQDIEMAKEWSCEEERDGFANIYEIETTGLKLLNLNSSEFTILHWLTVLLKNRSFRVTNPIAKDAKEYLLTHFFVDTQSYDIVVGYRADDSYFSFAEDFLNNAISVEKLSRAMKLGNLGEQFVLISPLAFERIQFVGVEVASKEKYYMLKSKRDKEARTQYLHSDRKPNYSSHELYMLDILRQEVRADDIRLR